MFSSSVIMIPINSFVLILCKSWQHPIHLSETSLQISWYTLVWTFIPCNSDQYLWQFSFSIVHFFAKRDCDRKVVCESNRKNSNQFSWFSHLLDTCQISCCIITTERLAINPNISWLCIPTVFFLTLPFKHCL